MAEISVSRLPRDLEAEGVLIFFLVLVEIADQTYNFRDIGTFYFF